MKNFNVEWIVPVIVAVVFVVGNIMRILNWKNEQDKKATRRPREFQDSEAATHGTAHSRVRSSAYGGSRISCYGSAA